MDTNSKEVIGHYSYDIPYLDQDGPVTLSYGEIGTSWFNKRKFSSKDECIIWCDMANVKLVCREYFYVNCYRHSNSRPRWL